jgi:hypothetical protein
MEALSAITGIPNSSHVMTHPNIPSTYAGGWFWSQIVDQPQYFLEQFPRHRDLGHLEDDVPCTRFEQTPLH